MALVLGAWSLGVPLKGKGHPPVKQLNAKHEKYGLPPTDEWHSAIKTHNKLRLDKVDDYGVTPLCASLHTPMAFSV